MGAREERPAWQLNAALRGLVDRLASLLARQRRRGRSPAVDALFGAAIEEGEAEGLVVDLAAALERPPAPASGSPLSSSLPPLDAVDPDEPPIFRAVIAFDLHPHELDALLLALAVELDGRFARLVAFLNDHAGRTRPTVGLALALCDPPVASPLELCERPIVRDGLLELEGDGPVSGLSLRVPRELLGRLAAASTGGGTVPPWLRVHPCDGALLDRMVLPDRARATLHHWAARVHEGRHAPPLVLLGSDGVGRGTAARAAFGAAGLPALDVAITPDRCRAVRREARWLAAGIVARVREVRELDLAALWRDLDLQAPVAFVAPAEAAEALAATAPEEPILIRLEPPGIDDRARFWQATLPSGRLAAHEIDTLAARFQFTPAAIVRAVRRAGAKVALESGEAGFTYEHLESSCRELGSASMGRLAQRMPLPYEREDLVLPAPVLAELDLAIAWVQFKRRVFEAWGFARRVSFGRGLTALFAGDPGTGKTMAAQVLARDLGMELYRVDLSRVMSKYIGETEKNLSQLFDEAHAAGAVLFFDEADAIFGKRTEVKDAHDRYANVEIGYLLQRMEEHEGVTILATNRMGDLDEAFMRRFHFVLDFPMPDAERRLRIWNGMIPRDAEREPGLDATALAKGFEVSGGAIRNSVLSAAYFAAAEGSPIALRHLKRGLKRELAKNGRVLSVDLRRSLED